MQPPPGPRVRLPEKESGLMGLGFMGVSGLIYCFYVSVFFFFLGGGGWGFRGLFIVFMYLFFLFFWGGGWGFRGLRFRGVRV